MSQYDNKNRSSQSRRKTSGTNKKTSGIRSTQRSKTGATNRGRNNNKRKNSGYNVKKIAILVGAALALIVCIMMAVKALGKSEQKKEETTVETTAELETELQKEVMVEGISITGLSREQAKETILKKFVWEMKVKYEAEEHPLENMLEPRVDKLLEDIFTGTPKEQYTLDLSGLEEAVETQVQAMAKKWDVPAKNGAISGFNKENGSFIYSGEQSGKVIDQQKLTSEINTAIKNKNFTAVVTAISEVVAPEISEAQAKELYQVIGTYSTKTTSNKDRNTNIRLAGEALNGLIVPPGGEFSFNKTTGNRTIERGYKPAGAYQNGILVEEPGGGVCQVSSTLYNAVVFAGLTTTERHAHSYEPSYVTPGEDAMVSYDGYAGPDMRFVNNSPSAIALRASFADQKLTISIVGIRILEPGVVLSMHSEKKAELDPPAPTYEEDQTLEPDVEKVAKEGTKGSRWATNLITKKDGKVISDEFFHNSTYRGKAPIIKRNTSGVVIPSTTIAAPVESTPEVSTPPTDASQTAPDATRPDVTKPGTTAEQVGPGVTTAAPPPTAPTLPPNATEATQATQAPDSNTSIIVPNPMAQTTAAIHPGG